MGYDVYYSGEVKVTPPLTEVHTALLQALVNFEQTETTKAIFAAIAASPEPDLPGHGGVLEVSEDREYLLPEEGESRHGSGCGSGSSCNMPSAHSGTPSRERCSGRGRTAMIVAAFT